MKNRTIKFRAWDVKESKMIYYGAFQFNQCTYPGVRPDNVDVIVAPMIGIESGELICDNDLEAYYLMQYTGLLDSKGVEIYEGDIIRIESTGDIKKVFYRKCSFGIDVNDQVFAPIYWHNDVTVIGNIYESKPQEDNDGSR